MVMEPWLKGPIRAEGGSRQTATTDTFDMGLSQVNGVQYDNEV